MPRLSESIRADIKSAENAFKARHPNLGTEMLQVAQSRTMLYLAEILTKIEKHLGAIAMPFEEGSPFIAPDVPEPVVLEKADKPPSRKQTTRKPRGS